MSNAVKFLGTTGDRDSCDCCGRANLRKTVVLDIAGTVVYYGEVCAARALTMPAAEVRKAAKKADDERREAERMERQRRDTEESRRWFAFLDSRCPGKSVIDQIASLGGMVVAREAWRASEAK